ncbi:Arc family DNA-binding protein [Bradyrhizobium sp. Ash2021]|uniref:Arc family DNA-binding protein n=1 Tax=Bradyrhizobium sp. Ash2021 TaxID=2954771 RepID=UPI002815A12D|nr:Arc family DNA-binding protein [Bradyrhizobium sp. Ash2021]WMT71273.1 Arc family DNA-binding protein [Bradyrhizobium sp. Ash2021]
MAKKKSESTNAVDRLKRNVAALDRMHAASKVDPMPSAKPPGRGSPQFVLRYSPKMRDQIARLAKANGRSINSELIALLERALNYGDDVEQLQGSIGEIFDRVERLESVVRDHDAKLSGDDDPANED